ncbi:MAG TPA: hypothetical protein VF577_08380 [Allosphingosinicella sp.]|jgi:hypothetical protein
MTETRKVAADITWGIIAALLLHIVMITLAVAWVAFYSYVLDPGHDRGFYEAYAGRSSPIVSLIAGGPVFYLASAWLTRRRGNARSAWIAAALYLVSDLAVFAAVGGIAATVALAFLSGAVLKLAGTALGARLADA